MIAFRVRHTACGKILGTFCSKDDHDSPIGVVCTKCRVVVEINSGTMAELEDDTCYDRVTPDGPITYERVNLTICED